MFGFQVSPDAKKKAIEAKARGDEAFKRKIFSMALDAYTQVMYSFICVSIVFIILLFLSKL